MDGTVMTEGDEVVTEMLKDMEEVIVGFSPTLLGDVDVANKLNMADDINVVVAPMIRGYGINSWTQLCSQTQVSQRLCLYGETLVLSYM